MRVWLSQREREREEKIRSEQERARARKESRKVKQEGPVEHETIGCTKEEGRASKNYQWGWVEGKGISGEEERLCHLGLSVTPNLLALSAPFLFYCGVLSPLVSRNLSTLCVCFDFFVYSLFPCLPDDSERSQSSRWKTSGRKKNPTGLTLVFRGPSTWCFKPMAITLHLVCINPWPSPGMKYPCRTCWKGCVSGKERSNSTQFCECLHL